MSNGQHYYQLYGVSVRSAVSLGFGAIDGASATADTLTLLVGDTHHVADDPPPGELIAERIVAERPFYTATEYVSGYVLRFHGHFDFSVDKDLRAVRAVPDPDADASLLPVFFTGTVMAFLLGLAGHLALHASAVLLPDRGASSAIGFMGYSGAGKTTIAGLCCAAGATFLTDDVLRVGFEDGHPSVVGTCPELRLRSNALQVLDAFTIAPPTRTTSDGRTAVALGSDRREASPLRALVVPLLSRTAEDVELRHLAPLEAFLQVARSPRIAGWSSERMLRMQFDLGTALAEGVPVYLATLPWSDAVRPSVGVQLLESLDTVLA